MAYRLPLIEVMWRDAESEAQCWVNDEDIDVTDCIVCTVGFELTVTEHFLVVASSINTDGANMSNGRIKIPLSMIVSKKALGKRSKKENTCIPKENKEGV